MSLEYINEAFRSLDLLTEDVFRADSEGITELSDFMSSDVDDTEDTVSIIDMDAETEDDLQDSYVGKVIIDCNICHSHIFKNKEDIILDIEGNLDIDEDCPYCGENNDFVIVGEIREFTPATEEPVSETEPETVETEPTEDSVEDVEVIEESLAEAAPRKYKPSTIRLLKMIGSPLADGMEESLEESFKNVSLETEDQIMTMTSDDNGKVTVTTEPVETEANEGEVIAPVSDETEADIINANAEVIDDTTEETTETEIVEEEPAVENSEDEIDFDFDEVDEDSMNEIGESYLKRVYENVDSFKLSSCSTTPNQLIIEGLITFKSGAQKNTGFIFEAKDATKDGKLRFIGENAHLARGRKAFTLVGSLNENKLICESFTYNYRAKNADGKSTRVYGKVNRDK